MKKLIKKILREEVDGFEWARDNSISGEQLRELILQTGATSIPFDKVWDNLDLRGTPIKDLGNLQSVGGSLDLEKTFIENLGNLQSVGGYLDLEGTPISDLGNLQSVGGNLYLMGTPIKNLGNLQSVGGYLYLRGTPFAEKHSEEQIRQLVQVGGDIYL